MTFSESDDANWHRHNRMVIPLSPENEKLFDRIWEWFVKRRHTSKDKPAVTSDPSDEFSGKGTSGWHQDGLIGIDETCTTTPLGETMLEEIAHHIKSGERPESSADFSAEFMGFFIKVIADEWSKKDVSHEEKRRFQDNLVQTLWGLIEPDITDDD